MTIRRHRRYSTDFKIQLGQAYLDGEGSVRAVAGRHGVGHSLLGIWIQKYEAGELTDEVHLREQVGDYEAKIASLERKVGVADHGARRHEKKRADASAGDRRSEIDHLRTRGIPVQRGCRLMNLPRSTYYKRPDPEQRAARQRAEADLRLRIEGILVEFPSYGYRRVTHALRREGEIVNHKRVARVMREHAQTPRRLRAWMATTNGNHAQPVYPNLAPTRVSFRPGSTLGRRLDIRSAGERLHLPRRRPGRLVTATRSAICWIPGCAWRRSTPPSS